VRETCRELIPAGSVFAFLAGHREALFSAGMFAGMYPSPNGRPGMPPQVLTAVVVLQALHGLPDYEAAQAVRCDLRWKAACGLGLLDPGSDPSLLTYFRRRLARPGDPGRLFAKVKETAAATGVLAGKRRRALDSTVLDDAVATQDTVTQLVAAVRRVIREVPARRARCCAVHRARLPGTRQEGAVRAGCGQGLRAVLLAGHAGKGDVMPRVRRSGYGDGLPGTLRRSGQEAQEAFTRTYQEAVRAHGEGDQAVRAAFAALKRSFEKRGDHWIARREPGG
jgi:hypothetical protein